MENRFDISAFVNVLTVQTSMENLARRFRKRRKEKKLSQKKIARQSGVSYASVRRFESSGQISLHSLMELARVLGCLEDFNELFKTPVISDLKDYDDD